MTETIYEQLKRHEGLKLKLYRCTAGKLTIGIGHNIEDKGITENTARFIFEEDVSECIVDLHRIFDDFSKRPVQFQKVLVDMRFQLGPGGFRNFKRMIRAIKRDDLPGMIREMKDSAWYHKTQNRADDLIEMVEMLLIRQDDQTTIAS